MFASAVPLAFVARACLVKCGKWRFAGHRFWVAGAGKRARQVKLRVALCDKPALCAQVDVGVRRLWAGAGTPLICGAVALGTWILNRNLHRILEF